MGNEKFLREFVTRNADSVLRECYLMTGDINSAEELFQEVFSRAVRERVFESESLLAMVRTLREGMITA